MRSSFVIKLDWPRKLLKLSSDERKIKTEGKTQSEMEDKMAELVETQRNLEKQNAHLKGKMSVLKQQLEIPWKHQTPYGHIPSKINSVCSLINYYLINY